MPPALRGLHVTPAQIAAGIARLEVKVDYLTESSDALKESMKALEGRVEAMEKLTERGRGAWATLACGGAVLATLLSAGVWAFEHVLKGGFK